MPIPENTSPYNEPASSQGASVSLPAPAANVSYVVKHISARLVVWGGPPAAGQTGEVQVLDGAALVFSTPFAAPATLGASDAIDVDLDLVITPGNAVTVKLNNWWTSQVTESVLAIIGTQ